ncbi:MAG: EamA family transporter [Apibacter sp.]|uniref:EamA family transporter n=1 Tax=Apibacter sp. TaxID=2023709 RepID=UPI0025EAA277|nr:EamA family transporter [Apibacter sp.]MCT6868385.1 EamA family transporter [Apibacter sp.]
MVIAITTNENFSHKIDSKYHMLALFTVIIWGTTFISTKILINNGLTPTEIFLYRFLLAYVCIGFFSSKVIFAKNYKDELLLLFLRLFGGLFYFIAENTALKLTLVSNVSLILSTTPIVTVLIYKNEKLTANLVKGLLLVLLVVYNGRFILKINFLGDLLTFMTVLSWSFYSLILNTLEKKYPILYITRKVFFYGIITLIPFIFINPFKFQKDILITSIIMTNLVFLGIVAFMICFLLGICQLRSWEL